MVGTIFDRIIDIQLPEKQSFFYGVRVKQVSRVFLRHTTHHVTVEGYFQILIDTLLGNFIYPYHKKIKRDLLVAIPKFYLFDVGVANYLAHRELSQLKGDIAGKSLEHYILME